MSFIDTYMKHRAGEIAPGTRKNLDTLEKELDQTTSRGKQQLTFLEAIKDHGGQISDLIDRLHKHFENFHLTWSNAFSTFHFVYGIAVEVYQIIKKMQDSIVPDGITGEPAWIIKKAFGQDLTYFIWKTVGPLDHKFNWMPFKKTIEKALVRQFAGMGMDAARKLFENNQEISNLSTNITQGFIKAL